MAIFSLNHGSIGRTTHKAGAASDYARYVTRPEACTEVVGARMPTDPAEIGPWLRDQEQSDRRNARVIDKVMVALPIELDHQQRVALLIEFAERMTEGRASWIAGIHDGPRDADNPHAHILFRDRDVDTGARVMLLSEKGSTERMRGAWEYEVNMALEREGFDQRVDRRSLEDQGIDREPQLHVGAAANELTRRNVPLQSEEKLIHRLVHSERTPVTVNYPEIDHGKTRFEENEERKARNRDRALDPELDWTQRGGMVAQQRSAMEWVKAAGGHARALYAEALRQAESDDAGGMAFYIRREDRRDRFDQPTPEEPHRQHMTAEAWDRHLSEPARTLLEEMQQQHEKRRDRGLER